MLSRKVGKLSKKEMQQCRLLLEYSILLPLSETAISPSSLKCIPKHEWTETPAHVEGSLTDADHDEHRREISDIATRGNLISENVRHLEERSERVEPQIEKTCSEWVDIFNRKEVEDDDDAVLSAVTQRLLNEGTSESEMVVSENVTDDASLCSVLPGHQDDMSLSGMLFVAGHVFEMSSRSDEDAEFMAATERGAQTRKPTARSSS